VHFLDDRMEQNENGQEGKEPNRDWFSPREFAVWIIAASVRRRRRWLRELPAFCKATKQATNCSFLRRRMHQSARTLADCKVVGFFKAVVSNLASVLTSAQSSHRNSLHSS
jgi:hypothetical protein